MLWPWQRRLIRVTFRCSLDPKNVTEMTRHSRSTPPCWFSPTKNREFRTELLRCNIGLLAQVCRHPKIYLCRNAAHFSELKSP